MKQSIANYTVIIDKEQRTGTDAVCYTVYVPVLGIATEGDTIEQAQETVKELIEFHLDSLAQEGEAIPLETTETLVTRSQVKLPANSNLAFT